MFRALLKPLKLLLKLVTDATSSSELAYGFAMGMLIGMVPKDNLLALILSTILLATRVNLAAAAAGTAVFVWVGMLFDPLSHQIGLGLLTCTPLESTWTWLYGLPLVPWTHFNNTVVLGSLVLGTSLFLPVYFFSRVLIDRYRSPVEKFIAKYRVLWWVDQADKVTKWSVS
jgi:uncharacterized protein (TIGR03546 family)